MIFSGLIGLATTFVSLANEEESTQVRSLIDAGRYDEAQSAAERLLANTSAEAGSESEASARAGDLLVEALSLNGRGAEATSVALASRVVQSKESRLGSNDSQLAISLRNLGDV